MEVSSHIYQYAGFTWRMTYSTGAEDEKQTTSYVKELEVRGKFNSEKKLGVEFSHK